MPARAPASAAPAPKPQMKLAPLLDCAPTPSQGRATTNLASQPSGHLPPHRPTCQGCKAASSLSDDLRLTTAKFQTVKTHEIQFDPNATRKLVKTNLELCDASHRGDGWPSSLTLRCRFSRMFTHQGRPHRHGRTAALDFMVRGVYPCRLGTRTSDWQSQHRTLGTKSQVIINLPKRNQPTR